MDIKTIIFTEDCPLDCRYCDPKNENSYKKHSGMNKKELFDLLEKIDKECKKETKIIFSGGEPFLYWNWLKELIIKYQNRFVYEFNTSGYLLTEEILCFLHNYNCFFNLSVDGDEKLTNYLRPVKHTKYHTGYFKQLKKIIPSLLFYFPYTSYKLIVNARYVDLVYKMYLTAQELGFQTFTILIDFCHRRENNIEYQKWTEEHTNILQQQLFKIVEHQILSYQNNIKAPEVIEINKILNFLTQPYKNFSPDNIQCKLFDFRTITSVHQNNRQKKQHCFSRYFSDLNDLYKVMEQQYKELNGKCKINSECPVFDYCCIHNCPQRGYTKSQNCFDFDLLECYINQCSYKAAIYFLELGNKLCSNNNLYNEYILKELTVNGHCL